MAEITEIADDARNEIAALADNGLTLLDLPANANPKDIVAAITALVRDCKAGQRELPEEQAYALGALLGCQYVSGLGWHWGSAVWNSDPESGAIGVLNDDNSAFNNPIGWIFQVMASDGGVPFMLSYNMIAEKKIPAFAPGSATALY